MLAAGALAELSGRKRIMVGLARRQFAGDDAGGASRPIGRSCWRCAALAGLALSGLPAVAMAYLADEMDAQALGLAMGLYIAGSTLGGMAGGLLVAVDQRSLGLARRRSPPPARWASPAPPSSRSPCRPRASSRGAPPICASLFGALARAISPIPACGCCSPRASC